MFVVGAKQATDVSGPRPRARRGLQAAGRGERPESDSLKAGDPAFKAAVNAVLATLADEAEVMLPLHATLRTVISADGRSALVEFQIRGDADLAVEKIDPILLGIAEAQAAHPQFFIGTFGDASVDQELEGAFMDDLKKAGLYSVPITLIILIVVFGALVAAGIPLLLATAVLATFGCGRSRARSGRATSRSTR